MTNESKATTDVTEDMLGNRIELEDNELASNENTLEDALEDVPDADDIQKDSPIDPAAPPIEVVHGTDLLNGYHD